MSMWVAIASTEAEMRGDGAGSVGSSEGNAHRRGQQSELPSMDPCSDKVSLQVSADIQQTDRKSIKP